MIKFGIHDVVIHQFSNKFGDGSFGRIALSMKNFIKTGGYDESFEPMAYQDNDLLVRLMVLGLNYIHLGNRKYNRAIRNRKDDGLKNSSSSLTWKEMLLKNFILSQQNITSGKIVANSHQDSIGITTEIYSFDI